MEKVRVLQGCSICEGGIWFNQGAVVLVADPSVHIRTVTDKDGKVTTLPCTEPAADSETNTPAGILPQAAKPAKAEKAPEAPEQPVKTKGA